MGSIDLSILPDEANIMNIDIAVKGPSKRKKVPLPQMKGRSYGLFFTEEALQDLVTAPCPYQSRRLLFAHCKPMADLLSTCGGSLAWTWVLYNGDATHITVKQFTDCYKPFGSTIEATICIELFGASMPKTWYIDEHQSSYACVQLLKNAGGQISGNAMENITKLEKEDITKRIKDGCAQLTIQKTYYSCLASVIYSICRTGFYSSPIARKVATELTQNFGMDVVIPELTVVQYWSYMGKHFSYDVIAKRMKSLESHFAGRSIELDDLLTYAQKRRLTQYYCVQEALSKCTDFPWYYFELYSNKDLTNYEAALEKVQNRPYYGYGKSGNADPDNYPALAYVSVKLCQLFLDQDSLKTMSVNGFDRLVNTKRWDEIIDKYIKNKSHSALVEGDILRHQTVSRKVQWLRKKIVKYDRKIEELYSVEKNAMNKFDESGGKKARRQEDQGQDLTGTDSKGSGGGENPEDNDTPEIGIGVVRSSNQEHQV